MRLARHNRFMTRWLLLISMLVMSISFIPLPESEGSASDSGRVTVAQLVASNTKAAGAANTVYAKKLMAASVLCALLLCLFGPERNADRPKVQRLYLYPWIPLRLKQLYLSPLKFTSDFVS